MEKNSAPRLALTRRLKVDVAALERFAQVVTFVEHALGGVCVSVDDDGGFVDGERVCLFGHGRNLRSGLRYERKVAATE